MVLKSPIRKYNLHFTIEKSTIIYNTRNQNITFNGAEKIKKKQITCFTGFENVKHNLKLVTSWRDNSVEAIGMLN